MHMGKIYEHTTFFSLHRITENTSRLKLSQGTVRIAAHLNPSALDDHSAAAEAASTAHHCGRPGATLHSTALSTAGLTTRPIGIQPNWTLHHTQAAAKERRNRGSHLQVGTGGTVGL